MPAGEDIRRGTWPVIVVSCALAAAAIDLGSLHRSHDADSLLPVLISMQRWKPFYWGQDRYGMLLPLLARPFADPLTNLLVQAWLSAFAGLLLFFLLARVVRAPRFWICGLSSAVTFLLLCPAPFRAQLFLLSQPYGVSLALGLGGLLLWDSTGNVYRAIGLALLLCAHWVNINAWLLLLPLVISRDLLARSPRAAATNALLVLACAAFGWALMMSQPFHPTSRGLLSPELWPTSWGLLATHAWSGTRAWLPACALLGAAGLVVAIRTRRSDVVQAQSAAAVLVVSAVAYWLIVGTSEWVKMNLCLERYVLPAIVALGTAFMVLATVPLADWTARHARATRTAVLAMLLAAAVTAYGFPAIADVRTDLERIGNPAGWTDDVVAAGCTHVAGTYWRVWPTVFWANVVLHDRGEDRMLWGVTLRGMDARRRWLRMPRNHYRVCVAPNDLDASPALKEFRLEWLVPASENAELRVLTARPREGSANASR